MVEERREACDAASWLKTTARVNRIEVVEVKLYLENVQNIIKYKESANNIPQHKRRKQQTSGTTKANQNTTAACDSDPQAMIAEKNEKDRGGG